MLAFYSLARANYGIPETFDRPGAINTTLWDIGNDGTIVGQSQEYLGQRVAFYFRDGMFTSLQTPQGATSMATGISNDGTIVGNYSYTDVVSGQAGMTSFVYVNGAYQMFAVEGTLQTSIRRISPNGRYLAGTYAFLNYSLTGFVYDRLTQTRVDLARASTTVILQGVSDDGVAVGSLSELAALSVA